MTKFKPYGIRTIKESPYWGRLPFEFQEALELIGQVLAFRANEYVLENLIDWDNIPDDPMFRMIFPHPDMLSAGDYGSLRDVTNSGNTAALNEFIRNLRERMNPQPGGQLTHNLPELNGKRLPGLQHKYAQTVVSMPSAAQTCHAYCTYCFRWPQFVGDTSWKIDSRETDDLRDYLAVHPEITDVLISGGDPMIMSVAALERCLEAMMGPEGSNVQNIRIGTKALTYWPFKFLSDSDSDDLMRLLERVIRSGKSLTIVAHLNHVVELQATAARSAAQRLISTGATIRMQGPLLRHVNDQPEIWTQMWKEGVRLGMIPYYMFVERDTGPRSYFEVPLARAYEIFRSAIKDTSGLARTVRGPVMSSFGGKVIVDGITDLGSQEVFILRYLQARDPELTFRPFFAKFDSEATWFDELVPARTADNPFFEANRAELPTNESHQWSPLLDRRVMGALRIQER